jgi:hypothetical protein
MIVVKVKRCNEVVYLLVVEGGSCVVVKVLELDCRR